MAPTASAHVVLEAFQAVEQRDLDALLHWYHPDVEFCWPPSLPYGGTYSGSEVIEMGSTFAAVWDALQPTDAERRMDPRVIASDGSDVVVLYHQRAVDASGARLDTEVLGLYQVRDERLVRAQMFYFDEVGLSRFLQSASRVA
jgi:ketosteroid isomerase-like protein